MHWQPDDPQLAAEIARLHDAARASDAARAERGGFEPGEDVDDLVRLGSEYLALSPDEAELVYVVARAMGARNIVEFGASFGVSTLYLAAAARANGGQVTTTEVHPRKCAALRDTLNRAGVADIVTLLEGDARETLASVGGPVDLLLLDGWKGMYTEVLDLVGPRMPVGGLVIADNLNHVAAGPYVRRMRPGGGWLMQRRGAMGLSLKLA